MIQILSTENTVSRTFGWVQDPSSFRSLCDVVAIFDPDSPVHRSLAEKRLPLKRFAAPEEIAKGVAFLASPDATYMTGCVLTMDGGATLPVVAANDFV